MILENAADFALRQIDTLGYYLSKNGISNQVNRHNIIALAVTEKDRLAAEASRLELRARMRKHQLEQLARNLSERADHYIELAPKPLASRLIKAKARLTQHPSAA